MTRTMAPSPMMSTRLPPAGGRAGGMLAGHGKAWWLWIGVAAACLALSLGGHRLGFWIGGAQGLEPGSAIGLWVFLALLFLYVLLLAVPFVPGAEIGLFLLMVMGAEAALPVYGATVAALILSFGVGRLVPLPPLVAGLRCMGMARTAAILSSDVPLAGPLPGWAGALLAQVLRHRCCTLAILFNTPGNALLGGGGGIALAVGASRLVSVPAFLITVLVAVAPVPAAILLASLLT